MKELNQIKPVSWIKFTLYGLLLIGIYYSAFTWLITHDWEREAYSYCWLIPPVVFFLIWLKRDELASTTFGTILGRIVADWCGNCFLLDRRVERGVFSRCTSLPG